jgi:hypothetical protein
MDKNKEIEKDIESVVCTMGIEGMILSEQEKESLRKILRGEITFEEHIQNIIVKAKVKGKKYEPVL